MRIILTIMCMCILQLQAQTIKVAASTSSTATTIYTKAGSDFVTIGIVNKQATTDATQDSRLAALEARMNAVEARILKLETTQDIFFDKKYMTVVGQYVFLNIDSVQAHIIFPPIPTKRKNCTLRQ